MSETSLSSAPVALRFAGTRTTLRYLVRDKLALIAVSFIVILVLAAVFGPMFIGELATKDVDLDGLVAYIAEGQAETTTPATAPETSPSDREKIA